MQTDCLHLTSRFNACSKRTQHLHNWPLSCTLMGRSRTGWTPHTPTQKQEIPEVIVGLLMWLVYFWASYVVVKFLIRGATMHFAGHPAAQGLAAITEA